MNTGLYSDPDLLNCTRYARTRQTSLWSCTPTPTQTDFTLNQQSLWFSPRMCSWYASPWSVRPPLRTSELRSVHWPNAHPLPLSHLSRVWPQGGTSIAPPGLWDGVYVHSALGFEWCKVKLAPSEDGEQAAIGKRGLKESWRSAVGVWRPAVVWRAEHKEMLSCEILPWTRPASLCRVSSSCDVIQTCFIS